MLKKIISVLIIGLFCFSSLPFFSNAADDSDFIIPNCVFGEVSSIVISSLNSDNTIDSVITSEQGVIDWPLSSDLRLNLGYTDRFNYIFSLFTFKFPDSKFIQGQSYRFSFTLSGAQHSNYTSVYVPSTHSNTQALALSLGFFEQRFVPGEPFPTFSSVNSDLLSISEFDGSPNLAYSSTRLWNNSYFSIDITFPSDFQNNDITNQFSLFLLIYSNTASNYLDLLDVNLTPLGATKFLFDDYIYQQGVQDSLDEIESGLFGPGETYPALGHEDDISEFIEQEGEYNKDYSDELEDQLGSAGSVFDNNGSFAFLSAAFDDLILSNTSVNGLILFSLGIGLCVLILGRRLNA